MPEKSKLISVISPAKLTGVISEKFGFFENSRSSTHPQEVQVK